MGSTTRYRHVEHLFHITHEQNIPGIVAEGGLLSHNAAHASRSPTDVSDPEVQKRRASVVFHGRPLHDYVNLYFRAKGPMLSARRELQKSLVVLYVTRDLLHQPGVFFTDGNAASPRTRSFSDPSDLEQLDWNCLDAEFWTDICDGKRKRAAEVLVPDRVPLAMVAKAVVLHESLRSELRAHGWRKPVDVRRDWFF